MVRRSCRCNSAGGSVVCVPHTSTHHCHLSRRYSIDHRGIHHQLDGCEWLTVLSCCRCQGYDIAHRRLSVSDLRAFRMRVAWCYRQHFAFDSPYCRRTQLTAVTYIYPYRVQYEETNSILCLTLTNVLYWQYIFQDVCFVGCHGQLGVQDFRSAWLELINVGICGLMNKAIGA